MSTIASSTLSDQRPSSTPKRKSAKEERVNSALRAALSLHEDSQGRWEKLIADGAHDNEIWHALLKEFGGGGASQTDDGIQFAYLGGGNGVEPPKFWIDVPSHITYDRPTLKGAKLVHRVRELLQIPQMKPFDDTAGNGDGVPEGSALANTGDAAGSSSPAAESTAGHEFKPTTARNGRCVVCNKPRATKEHRAFAAQQKAREKAGKPKREARFWREQASGMTGGIAKKLRPYDTPGRKTLRKIEEYEARVNDGLQDQQWQETLINIADLVDEGNLPPVLFGLTNAYQVRQLMGSGRFDYAPSNMGPTIKTVEDLRAAHKALKPYVPELHDDPNLDPRDGTKWARDLSAEGDDGGSQEDASSGSSIAEASDTSELTDEGLIDLLGLISIPVDLTTVQGWTSEQRAQAESYAAAVHLKASDNDDIDVPDRPAFLPEEQSFREYFEQTIEPGGLLHRETPDRSSTPVIETAPVADPAIFSKEIEVELSDGDYKRLAREAAFKNLQIEELQAEKDRTVAEYKKKIGGLEEERDEIMRTIRRGHTLLDLEVYERRDYDRKIVETVRADNHAVVDSRAMTTRELQQPLPSL